MPSAISFSSSTISILTRSPVHFLSTILSDLRIYVKKRPVQKPFLHPFVRRQPIINHPDLRRRRDPVMPFAPTHDRTCRSEKINGHENRERNAGDLPFPASKNRKRMIDPIIQQREDKGGGSPAERKGQTDHAAIHRNCRNTKEIAKTSVTPLRDFKNRMVKYQTACSWEEPIGVHDVVLLTTKTAFTSSLSDLIGFDAKEERYTYTCEDKKYPITTCKNLKGLKQKQSFCWI